MHSIKQTPNYAGIYSALDIEEYHKIDGLSSTGISQLLDCPKKYKLYADGHRIDAKHFDHGKMVHTLVLEPHLFDKRFYVIGKGKKRTSAILQKIREEFGDITVVNESTYLEAKAQASAILEHPIARDIQNGKIEHSLFYYDTELEVLLKSRPDFYNDNFVLDIKTAKSVKQENFSRTILERGYHRQAALALDGLEALTGKRYNHFILLVVEKKWPYCVEAYVLSRDDGTGKRYDAIEKGRREIKMAVDIYKKCSQDNIWPSGTEKLVEINIPLWAQQ